MLDNLATMYTNIINPKVTLSCLILAEMTVIKNRIEDIFYYIFITVPFTDLTAANIIGLLTVQLK